MEQLFGYSSAFDIFIIYFKKIIMNQKKIFIIKSETTSIIRWKMLCTPLIMSVYTLKQRVKETIVIYR